MVFRMVPGTHGSRMTRGVPYPGLSTDFVNEDVFTTMKKTDKPSRFDRQNDPAQVNPRPDRRDLLNRRSVTPQPTPPGKPGANVRSGWPMGHRIAFIILLTMLGLFLWKQMNSERANYREISYTAFNQMVEQDLIESAEISNETLYAKLKQPQTFGKDNQSYKGIEVQIGSYDRSFELVYNGLINRGVEVKIRPANTWVQILVTTLPWILIFGIWLFFLRQMQGGPKGVFTFGKSRAKLMAENQSKVTFKDVAGVDEAKTELQEIIDFLKDPRKFQRLGGKIPKGVLLVGPPGTGKTLLARAVAGEAGVPFFSMSGSDFVEMFVGVGASRVRDLFDQGKNNAPCILFIDEIDAVGRQRGAGIGGGHDEREQTLNQLLVEMDGFETNEGVILLAATNRPDVLDPALLRPGRFDRHIVVDWPDVKARQMILDVHAKKIQIAKSVDLEIIAKQTPGMTGADLANVVNEAALLAARLDRDKVTMADFEEAKDKVMLGGERRTLVIDDAEKRLTAYHEAGHVLAARYSPDTDPIHKVSIIARGRALGLTHSLPTNDKHTWSNNYCLGKLTFMLGGRAAEMIKFDDITNGAANDIENATHLARKMVCEWGMSKRLGPLTFGRKDHEVFLGRDISMNKDYSEETAIAIDQEIRRLLDNALHQAENILRDHIDELERLTQALLQKEVLSGPEIDRIIVGGQGKAVGAGLGSGKTAEPAGKAAESTVPGVPRSRSRRRRRPSRSAEKQAEVVIQQENTSEAKTEEKPAAAAMTDAAPESPSESGSPARRSRRRRSRRNRSTEQSGENAAAEANDGTREKVSTSEPEPAAGGDAPVEPRKQNDGRGNGSKSSRSEDRSSRGKLVRLKIGGRQRIIRKMPAKKIRKIN